MGREGGGRPSRWDRFREFSRWRSPYLVRQGVFIAASVAIFMLLRLVDVSPLAAFILAVLGGSVIEFILDTRWDRRQR